MISRTRSSVFCLLILVFSLLLVPRTASQTSYPMITHTMPVAVQRGKTTEVTVNGVMDFSGVYKVLFDRPGIHAEVLPGTLGPAVKGPVVKGMPANTGVKLKLTVAADAPSALASFGLRQLSGFPAPGNSSLLTTQ